LRPGARPENGVLANQVPIAQVVAGQMRFEGRPALSSLVQPFDLKKIFWTQNSGYPVKSDHKKL